MDYYTILTDAGRALEAAALAGQARYTLETCVLGDSTEMPNPAQSAIRNEVWRGPISTLTQDSDNPTWLVIEVNVPPSDGGFTIREFGIYTDTGVLFAVGNYPETYKPALTEGTGVDLVVRPICEVSNATLVTLLTDTSIMMASKKYVDEQIKSAVPQTRTISTTAPLTGGGALSNNLSLKVNNASETAVGVVQLASVTEASAGTITSKAVTPAGLSRAAVPLTRTISTTAPLTGGGALSSNLSLKVNNASETAVGVVQLATDAEAIAGTVATKAITPKQLGISRRNIGEVYFHQGRSAPFGAVVADGGLVRRDMYPDLWKFAQAQNLVVTESAWQTQSTSQGSVGVYSSGDGTTTFRLPLMTDFLRGTKDPAKVGTWQGDAIRNITGLFQVMSGSIGGNPVSSDGAFRWDETGLANYATQGSAYKTARHNFDASRVVPTASENRPKTLFFLPCIHAYNAIIPKAQADMHGYLTALADKEDKIKTLTADTTIYVRTTGNDNNSGLTPADATATVQRAFQIAMLWRTLTYSVTIDIGPGTWPTISVPRVLYAVSNLYIKGAGSAATIISPGTTAVGITVNVGNPIVHISNLKITNANIGLHAGVGAIVYLREDIEFGTSSSYHIVSSTSAAVTILSDWKISGNAAGALCTDAGGVISITGRRLTLSGTINFSTAFAVASGTGYINITNFTYTGAATGPRYSAYLNGAIYTASGGANYFPGNAVGYMHTGGQYL